MKAKNRPVSMQTFSTSFQDRFFIRAEALVGVWKNKPQEFHSADSLNTPTSLPKGMVCRDGWSSSLYLERFILDMMMMMMMMMMMTTTSVAEVMVPNLSSNCI